MVVLSSYLASLEQSTDMEKKGHGQLMFENVKPVIGLANGVSQSGLQMGEESKWRD